MMATTASDFQKQGPDYAAAYEILARRCEYPPSLEVFDHELRFRREGLGVWRGRENPDLKVEGLARRLADEYHRTQWSQGIPGDDG